MTAGIFAAAEAQPVNDDYMFVICGHYGDGDICYPEHSDYWQSFLRCLADKLSFVIDYERKFGSIPRDEAIRRYRCISKPDWVAAAGSEDALEAPIAKLPNVQ